MIKIRILLAVLCAITSQFSVGAVESSTHTNQIANKVSIIERIDNLKQILENDVAIDVDPNADNYNWMAKDMMIYLRRNWEYLLESCKTLSIILPEVMKSNPQDFSPQDKRLTIKDLVRQISNTMREKKLHAHFPKNENFTSAIDFRKKMQQVGVVKCEPADTQLFFDRYGSMYNEILGRVKPIFENLKNHLIAFTRECIQANDLNLHHTYMSIVPSGEEVDSTEYEEFMKVIRETVDQAESYIKNPKRLVEDL